MSLLKTKHFLLFFVLISSLAISDLRAQSDTSLWVVLYRDENVGAPMGMHAYFTGADTTIDHKKFQELWVYFYHKDSADPYFKPPYEIADTLFIGYIYRDSLKMQAKLEVTPPDLQPFDICHDSIVTIYDFSLNVGDTIEYACSSKLTDSVMREIPPSSSTFGRSAVEIGMAETSYSMKMEIIDSIGSEYGLFYLCCPPDCPGIPCGYQLVNYCDNIGRDSCQIPGTSPVGIMDNSLDNTKINIFPNPANNRFHIELGNFKGNYTVQLVDLYGAIRKHAPNLHDTHVQLDLSGLSRGIYFVEIWQGNQILAREKIIKQ